MCFSAEADVVLGIAVGGIGIDAVRHVTDRRQLPLASLPLLFATHQLIEAFVWWGFDGTVGAGLADAAAHAYLLIAFVLPVVVPLSLVPLEPEPRAGVASCSALQDWGRSSRPSWCSRCCATR